MKQTLNTHACSLAGEGAAAYSLARGVAAAVTRKSGGGSVLSGMRGKTLGSGEKTLKPLLSVKQKQQPSAGSAWISIACTRRAPRRLREY